MKKNWKNRKQEEQLRLIELKNGIIQSMTPRKCVGPCSFPIHHSSLKLIMLPSDYGHQLHFTDEEIEAWKGSITHPRSV